MFRAGLIVVACAGLFVFNPMAKAQYYGPGNGAPGYGQGGHCERMEARAHELRERMRAEWGGR
jgi:hypothetical protein